MAEAPENWKRVALLGELSEEEGKVVHIDGRTVAVFLHQGGVYAVDNRCPHLGFPLHRGSVKDGILTCHWHHARFDLTCGGTFDIWADDVRGYPAEIRGTGESAEVWLNLQPPAQDPIAYYGKRLQDGMKYNLRLVIAKSVIGLLNAGGAAEDAVRIGAEFGALYARNGWGAGMTILTAMANLLPHLADEDRTKALYVGLTFVSRECAGQPPRFPLEPLETQERRPEVLQRWFRDFVELRDTEGAERTLRTAIEIGLPQDRIAEMLFAACTDHRYRDVGHPLDFTNKAFELLDKIGWERAGLILPSLLPRLIPSSRMEESSAWRHPIDIADLLLRTFDALPKALSQGAARQGEWNGSAQLAEEILSGEPADVVRAMTDALSAGATHEELAETVAYAAARRIVHFHLSNEFGDWDTVLHTFTYANAVRQALRRSPTLELLRGVFDAAMSVYLDRFLNMPSAALPAPTSLPISLPQDLLDLFNGQQQVQSVASLLANALEQNASGGVVLEALGAGLLREDAEFHTLQAAEAAFRLFQDWRGSERGAHVLIAAGRYLAAHSPTPRASGQTYQIARRLQHGDALFEA